MKTTSIYIAARYDRRFDLRAVAGLLQAQGHEVTAQWLWDGEEKCRTITEAAVMDVEDVRRADVLVFIGEPQASENRGGGRWFEFGMAHALGKRCIAVLDLDPTRGGHTHLPIGHESVFTALPDVEVVTSWAELVDTFAKEAA
jgi:nucleoside 2-deoxyribosyltransferase